MQKLNIGLVIEHFGANRGGAERWTWQFARWLLDQGHQLHIFARDCDETANHSKLTFHAMNARSDRCGFAAQVEQAVGSVGLDVLHDMGAGWHCDVMQPHGGSRAAYLRQYIKLKHPATRWLSRLALKYAPRYRDFNELARRQFGSSAAIYIALSHMVAEHLGDYHGIPAEQMRQIYNGVDLQRFTTEKMSVLREPTRESLGIRPHETCLLMVALNLKLKGAATLIRSAAGIEHARVLIVGAKRFSRYDRLAKQLGVNATFISAVDDPRPYYAAGDIYIQPTFYDPCSLVVLEALACGRPVITTRNNGAGELISEGREGYIVNEPTDLVAFNARIRDTIRGNSTGEMSRLARELAMQNSLEQNFSRIADVYQEICLAKQTQSADSLERQSSFRSAG